MADISTATERGSIEWFKERMVEIQKEATVQRIPAIICFDIFDPLSKDHEKGSHEFQFAYTGGITSALGLCERMKLTLSEDR